MQIDIKPLRGSSKGNMTINILTLFPSMFTGPFDESIIKRAKEKKLVTIHIYNMRDWAADKHRTVDDKPYGGGVGMVIRVDVVARALEALRNSKFQASKSPASARSRKRRDKQIQISNFKIQNYNARSKKERVILLTPQGRVFTQEKARELSKLDRVILICGHYEGFDERIREHLVDEEISIGEYVLTGGELPAMVVTDAVVRLLPGVLGKKEATEFESFGEIEGFKFLKSIKSLKLREKIRQLRGKLLEYPQYTRPENFQGLKVPEILLSGHHEEIMKWRTKKAIERTKKKREENII